MISDEFIQAALITKIKSINASGTSTVKEQQWQGDQFTYPAVRLDLEDNAMYYDEQRNCLLQKIEFSVYTFSEERSSKESSRIKGIIINGLMSDGFTLPAGSPPISIKFTDVRLIDNVPAIRQDERTWRAQARFSSYVNGAV